ncbi:hypothetical protein C8R45DRAFT_1009025 [Mycena sanguinolenta]|nr:hypothetical protein C8R45DRAFT_1009025 [Mycena sanguinolenta]
MWVRGIYQLDVIWRRYVNRRRGGMGCQLRFLKTCLTRWRMCQRHRDFFLFWRWAGGGVTSGSGAGAGLTGRSSGESSWGNGRASVLPVKPQLTVRGRRTKVRQFLTSAGTLSGTSSLLKVAVDSILCSFGHAVVKNATKSAFASRTTSFWTQ